MKRIISSNINSATNTCGIPAAPATMDAIEPSEVNLSKENDEMKRVVGSRDAMSKDLAIQIIKKASQALHAVLNLPDDIDGLDIYDYFSQSDFTAMEDVQDALMSAYMGMEQSSI